jgi:hypothetical protein
LRYQVNGVANGDQFGRAVAAVPVTGQVWRNVLVGARWGANGGYVRVFDGPTGALLDEQGADAPFDWFGHTVAASDVGLDGLATFGVGAYQGDTRSVSQAGYIYIFKEQ